LILLNRVNVPMLLLLRQQVSILSIGHGLAIPAVRERLPAAD
jgi:hypothetical protein